MLKATKFRDGGLQFLHHRLKLIPASTMYHFEVISERRCRKGTIQNFSFLRIRWTSEVTTFDLQASSSPAEGNGGLFNIVHWRIIDHN